MMTVDECMTQAEEAIDRILDEALANGEALLFKHDYPTAQEIESFRKWYGEVLAQDKQRELSKLKAWLLRDGETLH
jgi:hypothetical protein